MSNISLLLNRRLATVISGVAKTNKRLSSLDAAGGDGVESGSGAFLSLLREQREQLSLAQKMLAIRVAQSSTMPTSPLTINCDQLRRLGAELDRMRDLVDRLLFAAERDNA